MRRLYVGIFVFIGAMVFAVPFAHSFENSHWSIGLKGGINLADLHGDDVRADTDFKVGAVGGGFVTYSINDWVALQGELLYSQKGAESNQMILGLPVDVTGKLDYIEIPVLAKLTIPTNTILTPNIFIGPAFSFLVSANVKAESMGVTIIDEDTKDNQESFDFGMVFGGGVDVKVGTGKLTADVRYVLGLLNVDDPPIGEAPDIMNSVISFMVGYGF